MGKQTNSFRFKHLPPFKGMLHLESDDPCAVMYNDKMIGVGTKVKSTGKVFRCLWNSKEQLAFAKKTQYNRGRIGAKGYIQGDYLYITSLFTPPMKSTQGRRLHRLRENKAYDEEVRERSNAVFTGQQSSHNTYIPDSLKCLQVKYEKKEEKMKEPKKRQEKREVSDYEFAMKLEKRVQDAEAFGVVSQKLQKMATIRTALSHAGFTYDQIEDAIRVVRVATTFMNSRAK